MSKVDHVVVGPMLMFEGVNDLTIDGAVVPPGKIAEGFGQLGIHPQGHLRFLHTTNVCHCFGITKYIGTFGHEMAKILDV